MLCVDVMTHHDAIEFTMVPQQFQLIDSLRIRWHVDLSIHLEVRALEAEEVILTIAADVGESQQHFIIDKSA